ncbi:class I SAM-dependent methyltransferase [Mycobacterium sp. IDR2000157661]|uniref:class I SAM-dependent methyltransferase n=1 Tax=Mycobacterium sp. IDR2000157661 TaxID=2867005 RepID=UPI001EEA9E56|nr:class I SAM-dependent methyltransferase [Mycobacterium sp. IDR2000157661]ULE32835.1 class I SAM-dependent methyltransferase [Mycobacterium sp. IDR2000157661]
MSTETIWAGGHYEAVASRIAGIAQRVVAAVDRRHPLKGAVLADLACGTGSAALAAAHRGARVIGVDVTADLIGLAAQKAQADGTPIEWRVADAADTGLATGSVDAVISNMGIIFVEPHRQVTELARLLRPGGALGFSTWVRSGDNPLIDPIEAVLGPPTPSPGFSADEWGRAATATARLSADFTDIDITAGTHIWRYESVAAGVRFLVEESPIHVAALSRAGDRRADLVAAFEAALTARSSGDGQVAFEAPYAIITAQRR